jgi:large subunit ribosomal protein L6
MSRIGRAPISVPAGVDVKNENNLITVKGPKGELVKQYSKEMKIEIADGQITVSRPSDKKRTQSIAWSYKNFDCQHG